MQPGGRRLSGQRLGLRDIVRGVRLKERNRPQRHSSNGVEDVAVEVAEAVVAVAKAVAAVLTSSSSKAHSGAAAAMVATGDLFEV